MKCAWSWKSKLLSIAAMTPLCLIGDGAEAETITADVVAIDQVYTYNRFGSFNPYGMVYALRRDVVDLQGNPIGADGGQPCQVRLKDGKRPRPLVLRGNVGDTLQVRFTNLLCNTADGVGTDKPATRIASMVPSGLTILGDTENPRETGISGIAPGEKITYKWKLEREGTHLLHDNGAPAGGEGDGGSLVLGLFGAVNVEPAGSKWYRSQVSKAEMDIARAQAVAPAFINYEAVDANGDPVLNIRKGNEIIHADVDAIITGFNEPDDGLAATTEGPFREFTVIFHDELKAVQAFDELNQEQMHGVRDGFGINYGASGVGPILIANRLGQGPTKDCVECGFEEFFLQSWANGDPALLTQYADDPANVHHSYLNDKVKFRNLHAGPKETHIFHLHAHQWLAQTDGENATYIDSQTIGPRQGYNYEVAYGGTGNRNKAPGDAVFHCHLYPHFAQGMWSLWRIHDVLEDGSRRLPDGEFGAGTDPLTGSTNGGTPIPAVVPMPNVAMAPQPTYGANGMPGYPFYIAGKAGHRAPQPPLDLIADGGLPRHIITGGTRETGAGLATNDFSSRLTSANIQLLDPTGTPLEKSAMAFHAQAAGHATLTPEGNPAVFAVNGLPPQPGAPYADPCTPGLSTGNREYHVSSIQTDLVVNKAGWHDPQARIMVADSDVARFEGKKTTAEPFFFRANSGECVQFFHTNRAPHELAQDDFQVRTPTDIMGHHIHLVKFDPTASDGAANGFNYEDGSFARGTVEERIAASQAAGGSALNPDGTPASLAATGGFQTSIQRWFADPLLNKAGKDRTIKTVFTHDHFSPSSIQHHGYYGALLIEPAGSKWLNPQGQPLAGGVGSEAMIVGAADPATHPDHREYAMAVADFAIVYRPDGTPVNAPPAPEVISAADPGTFLVNYKHEPIPLRISPNGALPLHADARGDMANLFSSRVHGDPFTPVFKGYEGDLTQFRIVQGAHEEQHAINVHGLRWRREIANPASEYTSAQAIGISEQFNAILGVLPAASGLVNTADYLFNFGSTDDLWHGAWGLVRSFARPGVIDPATGQPVNLAALPNNPTGRSGVDQGNIRLDGCPADAPSRRFTVEAWAARDLLPGGAIRYNAREGIQDPSGLLYVLSTDVSAIRAGTKPVEPLVLRANAGDCVRVTLVNRLPANVPDHPGDAPMPPITPLQTDDFRPSNQVSLHPQLVSYDVRRFDGANVGYNQAQTVAPGQSTVYNWYAGTIDVQNGTKVGTPVEFGVTGLRSGGDVVKQGSQGLVGALVIEPRGATYTDPATGRAVTSGSQALVRRPDGTSFKEFVLVYQDGLNLQQNGLAIPDTLIADDPEDAGEKAVNYRTEPFWARLGVAPDANLNSVVFNPDFMLGGIETPLFTASNGQEVKFRVALPEGRARQRGFSVQGHDYPDAGLPNFLASGNSLMHVGRTVNASLYGGAKRGIWLYRDAPNFMFSGGVWGRFEVR